jgi:comEA protein
MKKAIKVSKIFLSMSILIAAFFLISTQTFADEKIDINKASIKELQRLEGIGKTLANRIVEYRTLNGPFQDIKEIMKVSGIGNLTFEKISGQIITGAEMNVDN